MPIPSSATAFGDADIATLLADMAIAIIVGGVAGIGLLDEADEIFTPDGDRGEVAVLVTTLTVRTTDFPAAAIGQNVQIGATTFYILRERLRTGDGALTKFLLGNYSLTDDGGTFAAPGLGPNIDGGTF